MPLLNLVEQDFSVGMLGKVRDGGAECGLVKDMRYMPDDGHLARFSCHFAAARLFGRCFDMSSAVSPGHVEKLPLLIAVINVVGTGGKSAW